MSIYLAIYIACVVVGLAMLWQSFSGKMWFPDFIEDITHVWLFWMAYIVVACLMAGTGALGIAWFSIRHFV